MSPYPETTEVLASAVILRGSDVLMVRESKPVALGRWSLPGGRVETGETLQAAAAREVAEETGCSVTIGPLLGVYHCPRTLEGGSAVQFVFAGDIGDAAPRPIEDHAEVCFIAPDRFDELGAAHLIRGRHTALAIEAARTGRPFGGEVRVVEASPPPR